MNERKKAKRRAAFLAIINRSYGHFPRQALEDWAMNEYGLLRAGWRGSRYVSDLAMSAWYLSAPPSWIVAEAKALWGRGWAQGKEVDC